MITPFTFPPPVEVHVYLSLSDDTQVGVSDFLQVGVGSSGINGLHRLQKRSLCLVPGRKVVPPYLAFSEPPREGGLIIRTEETEEIQPYKLVWAWVGPQCFFLWHLHRAKWLLFRGFWLGCFSAVPSAREKRLSLGPFWL